LIGLAVASAINVVGGNASAFFSSSLPRFVFISSADILANPAR
jgi:hypothetical protein